MTHENSSARVRAIPRRHLFQAAFISFAFSALVLLAIPAVAGDPLAALWKVDGTEYTIKDKTIVIDRYWGGQAASIVQVSFWRAQGWTMEINGDCYSNCAYIAEKLSACVRDGAKMGYHMSYDQAKNSWIDNRADFRPLLVAAIEAKGGFPK